ncbi:hypothetical protein ACFWVM_29310 [Nocardia fluminea]|uniref:hypothetical protein n=1 Tax=Nocardia fluminea TaxID=134984 RepID=UPI0036520854
MVTEKEASFDRLVRDLVDRMPGYNLTCKASGYVALHEEGHGLRFCDGDDRWRNAADRGRLIVIPCEKVAHDGWDIKPGGSGIRVSKTKSHKVIIADIRRRAIAPLLDYLDDRRKVETRIQGLAAQAYEAARTTQEQLQGWRVEAMHARPSAERVLPSAVTVVDRTTKHGVDLATVPLNVGAFHLKVGLVVDVDEGPAFAKALREFLDAQPWKTGIPDLTSVEEPDTQVEIAIVDEGTHFEAALFVNGKPVPAELYAVDAGCDLEFIDKATPPISAACVAQLEKYYAEAVVHAA